MEKAGFAKRFFFKLAYIFFLRSAKVTVRGVQKFLEFIYFLFLSFRWQQTKRNLGYGNEYIQILMQGL